MSGHDGGARHRSVRGAADAAPLDATSGPDAAAARPVPGPIAVLPDASAELVAAVESAGGVLAPLGDETRGIVWTANDGAAELAAVLRERRGIGWVQLPWAGVDAFAGLLGEARGDGRTWTSGKGAYAQPVAEHALALALALLRELPRRAAATTWQPDERGRSLYGAEVVVLGAGGVAVELLRLLEPFRVRATVVRRRPGAVPGAERTVTVDRLAEAVSGAELLFVAAALTEDTRGIVDAGVLAALAPGAIVVNVGRGAVIETEALVAALEDGRLGGAGLDVTDPEPLPAGHPLWAIEHCLVTPHVADTEEMTAPLYAERVAENVRAFLGDGRFVGRIDLEHGY
ncbi:NAD(P)-dependent oxidoreductase [Agromyces mediolanus]|uniref:NAD(P)-dependent oxidoreductase n=1 Tax=Agromyces mediolanus TaxID=41986 RepID=UPI003836B826